MNSEDKRRFDRISADFAVEIIFEPGDRIFKARLTDIGVDGAGLFNVTTDIPLDILDDITEGDSVKLRWLEPEYMKDLIIEGSIKYIDKVSIDGMRLGVEFSDLQTLSLWKVFKELHNKGE